MNPFKMRAFLFLSLLLLLPVVVAAQGVTTAQIYGTITDRSGSPLPGANIIATHVPTGTPYGTTTRENGDYTLPNLRVGGPYTLAVSYIGYARQEKTDIYLALSQSLRHDFVMSEEAIETEEVVITAERGALLSAARTGSATNVMRTQIDRLPTISRSFQDYYKLSPYFTGVSSSAAGRNNRYNNIQIDGANFNDLFGLGGTGTPGGQGGTTPISLESIEEFQIVLSPFDVRQAGFTGAGINAITRSGTNTFSGSAFLTTRSEGLAGLSPDALAAELPPFTNSTYGVRIGGPIVENKLFFFGALELARSDSPFDRTFGAPAFGNNAYTVSEDSLNALSTFLRNNFGYETGSWKSITRPDNSDKIFLRFDYNLSESHKLTARWNYLNAVTHNSPSRFRGTQDVYSENAAYDLKNKTHSFALQLTSLFGNQASNELIIGYNNQLDEPTFKGKPFPTVEVRVRGVNGVDNRLAVGSEEFRHQNELEQNVMEITDNFTYYHGDHTLTAGVKVDLINFRNLFIPDNFGFYQYNTLAAFLAGDAPAVYAFRYSATADPKQEANWGFNQIGFYLQDEWTVSPQLKIVGGVRFDLPSYPDKPNYNARFDSTFSANGYNLSTSETPKTALAISPRIGFNWALDEERNTQLRGGVGVFYGRFPAVWVSNQYSNTGVDFYTVTAPPANFIADPFGQPKIAVGLPTAEVNITDPDFKAPSILRFNLAADHRLPYDMVLSLEAIYSKTQNDVHYQNINLSGIKGTIAGENRPHWSTYSATTGLFSSAGRNLDNAFSAVYLVTNTDLGYNANIIAQVQRQSLTDPLYFAAGYTWGIARDAGGTNSTTASSGWRFNPTTGNPNAALLSYADADRTHRVFATVSYRFDWDFYGMATTVGLFYNGLSGRPFSWLVNGDVNGDSRSDNDLVYIPKDANDVVLVDNSGTTLAKTDPAYAQLMAYINNDSYLSENKGTMAERNAARSVWSHQVDLRLSHVIPSFMGHRIELTFDVTNLMNMINKKWGWVKLANDSYLLNFHSISTPTNDPTDPTTNPGGQNNGKARYRFVDPGDPNIPSNTLSRWTAQFGIRYTI